MRLYLNRLEEWTGTEGLEELLRRAARDALATRRPPPEGEVSITFVSREEIRRLNLEYLERDRPTDVIAFRLETDDGLLGDVYISPEEAAEAAGEAGIPVREELARLVVHGVLHLLGHEHPEDDTRDGSDMFRLQEELLRGLDV